MSRDQGEHAPPRLREWTADDSVTALTELLHQAYAPLGAMGLNYTAVDQSAEATRERLARRQCYVVEDAGRCVGTACVQGPHDPNDQASARHSAWLLRADVGHLSQLAVAPQLQRQGWGARLVDACITWARVQGLRALTLDTAKPAQHLVRYYAGLGFREVDSLAWEGKTYRSVVMLKDCASPPPHTGDVEHRAATVRAFWAHIQARDWGQLRALLDGRATMHWPASGEHFGDAEAIVRVQAVYPEGWTLRVGEVTARVDGSVHSQVEVIHPPQRFLASSVFHFGGERITRIVETWATAEAPPAWRDAATLGAYWRDPA